MIRYLNRAHNSLCAPVNNKIREKGVTLIELLAAVTVFVITIVAVSGILASGIRIQRRVLATQEIIDQASFVLEYMGRTLRMAKKDLTGLCIPTVGNNYQKIADDDIIFLDYQGNCTEFFLVTVAGKGQLKKKDITSGIVSELTSPKININDFNINLSGEAQPPTNYIQPRITLFLEISGSGSIDQPKIRIQTSISQRTLDVQYAP